MCLILCACSWSLFSSLTFFFNDTATTEIYTLSLHDALPISSRPFAGSLAISCIAWRVAETKPATRSEEHTSELQSQFNLVCRLLHEKKKKKKTMLLTTMPSLPSPAL